MKNLKKVLSLALAFAMVLSLCVFASAETQDVTTLADWDTVTDQDSAILLNAFNIMQGDEDGFRPLDPVKRSEAAKMISVALWGGNDNVALYANSNAGGYVDVELAAWYMGYANYVTVLGIMTGDKGVGVEGNTFRPGETVSGYELLKMALVALGYDAETEGFTGIGWELRVMAAATARGFKPNLTEGTTVTDWSAPLNRMNTATIIANMINREMVKYEDGKLTGTGEIFGVAMLGMKQVAGILAANEYGTIGFPPYTTGKTALDPEKDTGNAIVYVAGQDTVVLTLDTELLDLGTPVTIFYADTTPVSAVTTDWTEVELNEKKDNLETDKDGTVVVTGWTFGTGAWGEITYIDTNANGNIDVAHSFNYHTAKVTDVIETENFGTVYAVNDAKWNAKTMDKKDAKLGANFIETEVSNIVAEKGDYIAYTGITNVYGETYTYGYTLDTVEGKVDRIAADGKTVNIDGVSYKHDVTVYEVKFGAEGTFYTYADGTIAAYEKDPNAETPKADNTYAVFYDATYKNIAGELTTSGSTDSVLVEVAAVLEDGTVGVYEVASIVSGGKTYIMASTKDIDALYEKTDKAPSSMKASDLLPAKTPTLVQYTLDKDGKMTINLDITTTTYGTVTKVKADGTAKLSNGNYLTAETITFVNTDTKGGNKWTVVKGLDFTAEEFMATVIEGDYLETAVKAEYMMVDTATYKALTADPTTGFYYVIGNNGQVGEIMGAKIFEIVVFDGKADEVTTVQASTGTADTMWEKFDAKTGFATEITGTPGFISAIEGDVLGLGTSDEDGDVTTTALFTVTDETAYYLINGEDSMVIDFEDLTVQTATEYDPAEVVSAHQAIVVDDGSGNATIVIVFGEQVNVEA